MKLYEVTNGYLGNSYTRVYVIAEDEDGAENIARERYKEYTKETGCYEEEFYKDLKVECICEDTNKKWCSEVYDD